MKNLGVKKKKSFYNFLYLKNWNYFKAKTSKVLKYWFILKWG